jgi:hypothetical protein
MFQNTEELLKREANLTDVRGTEEIAQTDSEVSSVLSAYKSEGDPEVYEGAYTELKRFVEGALDIYKVKHCDCKENSQMQDSVLPADISHLHLSPLLLLCGFS